MHGLAASITYSDPAITFDPAGSWEPVYEPHINTTTVTQVRPVPDPMRELAAPLTLGDTVTVTFERSGDADEGTYGRVFTVQLDPELNHGYTRAWFHAHYQDGRGFDINVGQRAGDHYPAGLGTCYKCGSPWRRAEQQNWGIATDCEECGHHTYYSIGD
jgi:hypothetical protein